MHYHKEFEPPVVLQDHIKCFWHTRRNFGDIETMFEVMPDGYAEIIFLVGGQCSIFKNGGWEHLPSPFIMGLLNQSALLRAKNRFEIIAARCFPWTVFDLLGLEPGKEYTNLTSHPIALLQAGLEKCIHNEKAEEAVESIKQYFINGSLPGSNNHTLVKAGDAMRLANGTLPVSQVAEAAHATVRTLERKFKKSSGFTVKDVSGLMRFEQVRNHLWLYPDANLASLALDLGYTDQAHLSREFKRYSGTTPAAFARNEGNADGNRL